MVSRIRPPFYPFRIVAFGIVDQNHSERWHRCEGVVHSLIRQK